MTARVRIEWRRVDGVLLLDKPHGVSSNVALQTVRRLYRAERAGHGGTLDPLATGLLPVLFGEATKFGAALLDGDKRYRAEVAFGTRTSTGDAEGEVVETAPVRFERAGLEAAVRRFTGVIEQIPPMYSALKHAGRPLYDYARAGREIVRAPRRVTISTLTVESFDGAGAVLDVRCSKGTYVRTLAEDLGRALGSAAHLAGLRRLEAGPFSVDDALTCAQLAALDEAQRDALLRPVDALLTGVARLDLDADAARRLASGQAVAGVAPGCGIFRAYGAGRFLGLCEGDGEGVLRARRLVRGS